MRIHIGRPLKHASTTRIATTLLVGLLAWMTLACDAGSGDGGWSGGWHESDTAGWEDDTIPYEQGAVDNNEGSGRQERGQDPGKVTVEEEEDPETGEVVWSYLLEYSDLILSPDGKNLLMSVPKPGPEQGFDTAGMVLAVQPLPAGETRYLPKLQDLSRINFAPNGGVAYLLDADGTRVRALELTGYTLTGEHHLPGTFSVLDVTPDGAYLILSNLPKTDLEEYSFDPYAASCTPPAAMDLPGGADLCKAAVVDLTAGTVWELDLPHRVRDIDFDPLSGEVLISYSLRSGGPDGGTTSYLVFYNVAFGAFTAKLTFPNCSDEVEISLEAGLALQSPTACTQPQDFDPNDPLNDLESSWGGSQPFHDPISIIDLETRQFVENLPGFGPVALTGDGTLAAGFTLRHVMEEEWGYHDQVDPVGIILVTLPGLEWDIVDVGSEVPAYTFSPDGGFLYLYSDNPLSGSTVGRIDTGTLALEWLQGPEVDLDAFVWSPDGGTMYTVSKDRLYAIRNDSAEIREVELPVSVDLINIRPQGDFILVGPDDQPLFYTMFLPKDEALLPIQQEFDLDLDGGVLR
jgi:dipeptidyl aminopeptidase/acylaminoacyl peptidase